MAAIPGACCFPLTRAFAGTFGGAEASRYRQQARRAKLFPEDLVDTAKRGELAKHTMPSPNAEWAPAGPVEPTRRDAATKEPISLRSSGKRYAIGSSASNRRTLQENVAEDVSADEGRHQLLFSGFASSKKRALPPGANDGKLEGRSFQATRDGGGDGAGFKIGRAHV